jgi:hypothetical protein
LLTHVHLRSCRRLPDFLPFRPIPASSLLCMQCGLQTYCLSKPNSGSKDPDIMPLVSLSLFMATTYM